MNEKLEPGHSAEGPRDPGFILPASAVSEQEACEKSWRCARRASGASQPIFRFLRTSRPSRHAAMAFGPKISQVFRGLEAL
jgi:hypothetical protein